MRSSLNGILMQQEPNKYTPGLGLVEGTTQGAGKKSKNITKRFFNKQKC